MGTHKITKSWVLQSRIQPRVQRRLLSAYNGEQRDRWASPALPGTHLSAQPARCHSPPPLFPAPPKPRKRQAPPGVGSEGTRRERPDPTRGTGCGARHALGASMQRSCQPGAALRERAREGGAQRSKQPSRAVIQAAGVSAQRSAAGSGIWAYYAGRQTRNDCRIRDSDWRIGRDRQDGEKALQEAPCRENPAAPAGEEAADHEVALPGRQRSTTRSSEAIPPAKRIPADCLRIALQLDACLRATADWRTRGVGCRVLGVPVPL